MFHEGVDVRVLTSASSDGEVRSWIMADDGKVTESGMYDTGNRSLCITIHDASIEQLDSSTMVVKANGDNSDLPESESNEEDEDQEDDEDEEDWAGIEDEGEWNGIDDA